ncbi:hypothetical protein VNO77_35120 [Canavalia gladiata]|uniref:Uncharacterized protein n=1 Tax=Canavalia gladiata TaxID=3824 RepID=A0AAN9KGX8_CANGL
MEGLDWDFGKFRGLSGILRRSRGLAGILRSSMVAGSLGLLACMARPYNGWLVRLEWRLGGLKYLKREIGHHGTRTCALGISYHLQYY